MKVSVVTAYYNRKALFYNTLLQLQHSVIKDFEVIAVDDGSGEENRLEALQSEFDFLKVIRLDPADKWYTNPCIPFNTGFKAARGEIIIIQNPECLHNGDILEYVVNNLRENDYLSFACYSLDKATTDRIDKSTIPRLADATGLEILPRKVNFDGDAGWYNHSVINPQGYHFCAALNKTDLVALKGFDERFALGVACDDNEFLFRVKEKGMNFKIIDEPFVLHQNHYFFDKETRGLINLTYKKPDSNFLMRKNEYLLKRTIRRKAWKIRAMSKKGLFIADFFLTRRLKTLYYLQSFVLRVKARVNLIRQK